MHSAAKILAHIVRGNAEAPNSKKRKATADEDEHREEDGDVEEDSDVEEVEDSNWAEKFNPVHNKSDKSTYNTGA